MAAAREHQAQLGPVAAEQREGLEQACVILVRPRPGGVQQQRLALLGPGSEARVVDAVVDDPDPAGRDPEPLDHPVADERRRDDDRLRRARRAVVGERAERPLAAREELRQIQVLEVLQRHHAGGRDRRNADRERVVDDAGRPQMPAQAARADSGERHRGEALTDRAGESVLGDDLGGEALRAVGGARRQVHAVGKRPATVQRAQQLAGRRLGAAVHAGDERQQRDPDHAAIVRCACRPYGVAR